MDDIEYGRQILRLEAQALESQRTLLDARFAEAVDRVGSCRGMVVTTGMGKSGLIARKISATLASTGTPSIYLHPAEAIHGDLGRVGRNDVVLALSRSGDVPEIRRLIPAIKRLGAPLVAITAEPESDLARHADCLLLLARAPEACPIGLAPTTSTTTQLALGDALAMAVAKRRNFTREEFALYHPGGALGRSLMQVGDLMRGKEAAPAAACGATVRDALAAAEGPRRRPGALPVVDGDGLLRGILTDGDVRRRILADGSFLQRKIDEVMTRDPARARADELAAEAWRRMRERGFDELPVVDGSGRYLGLLDVQDLLEAGLASDG